MFRNRILSRTAQAALMAAALGAALAPAATAQVRSPFAGSLRQDEARDERREGQRVDLREVVRRVSSGRQGRMLGVSERQSGGRLVYVIRWEYPGGRVADIMVDGRTGAVIGER
ncbi:PepSY domain-containing protein [Brevundimonas sp.]|uniref:PepSY domain-containing protein n=1 Tax=Brevundimonas sp. TaxID=1871086 RepID=UPI0025B832FE|nr:hypothetical protein [Brevundimonas sp.]